MATEQDLYEVLGVHPSADTALISQVYRMLSRKLHPDVGGDPVRMSAVNAAWDVLGDPDRRAAYDAERAQQAEPAQPQSDVEPDPSPAVQVSYEPAPEPQQVPGVMEGLQIIRWRLSGAGPVTRALVGVWVAASVMTLAAYTAGFDLASLIVLLAGTGLSLAAAGLRMLGTWTASWGFGLVSLLVTALLWSTDGWASVLSSVLMLIWTVSYLGAVELLAPHSSRA